MFKNVIIFKGAKGLSNTLAGTLLGVESYKKLLEFLKNSQGTAALATGVIDGQKWHLAASLSEHLQRSVVVITYSEKRVQEIVNDLTFFVGSLGKKPMHFPSKDIFASYADAISEDWEKKGQRMVTLNNLVNNSNEPFVLSIEALLSPVSPKSVLSNYIMDYKVADELSITKTAQKLIDMHYERVETVTMPGQFAIRGGILDIFVPIYEHPIRIELWGDEIDSIRSVDIESQRSVEKLDAVRIFTNTEIIESEEVKTCLLTYLPENTLVFVDEPARIQEVAVSLHEEHLRFTQNNIIDESPKNINSILSYSDVFYLLSGFSLVLLSMFVRTIKDFTPKLIVHFDTKSSTVFQNKSDLLKEDLQYLYTNNYAVLILTNSKTRAKRLYDELIMQGLNAKIAEDFDDITLNANSITLHHSSITSGFEYPMLGISIISYADISSLSKKTRPKKRKKGAAIESFTELNIGDYVVHDNHGIGIYKGIEKIEVDETARDYLKIEYYGSSLLYIATSQLDIIQKYIGNHDIKPKINKLGGSEWGRAKSKVKSSVEEMAKDLIELYAQRQASRGHVYSTDTVWQTEFEETFRYEETDDQLTAVEDIKRDMESVRVMDRLICGDVGYGKTEVAIRAVFKAVCDQKQVAYLCPTTILAQQHYNTFVERMKDFPVNIRPLSRFVNEKEKRDSLDGLKKGTVDIIIGTHRLLSKDIQFKDLGLVIVDEEQRFGVRHKEKLKELKKNVDVITLTATPIPRTLHMSLSGIRDMSILENPPLQRQPIQTYVMEHSDEIIASAVNRELSRGGQVYYLYNRVSNISSVTDKLQKLMPNVRIAYAHGQMNEDVLSNTMMDFISGNIDVLVCTTIIESGLDIPNTNTIIIQDADHLGLSQLYQLRGRVGRSHRSSFAYLLYKKDKVLTEIAEKRLQTIREFTALGSGFKIAMRDLEFRGAGSVLGSAQHGHMSAVGYEMYCKLLGLAVAELQGTVVKDEFETLVDINIDAFIPQKYINNELTKLEVYKKISHIQNKADFYDVQEEMEDRFGTIPKPAANLLNIALLKANAHNIGIISIAQNKKLITMFFKNDAEVNIVNIGDAVLKSKGKLKFNVDLNPRLVYKMPQNLEEGDTSFVDDILEILASIQLP